MVAFFISSVEELYGLSRKNFRYDLHLRFDQDEEELKQFWAKNIYINKSNIKYVVKDSRTKDKPTKDGYKGVCLVNVRSIAIQRRLKFLYTEYCQTFLGM